MKKIITAVIILALMMSFALCENNDTVTVIITEGSTIHCFNSVQVTDIDEDGALTINDALTLAHAAFHENGVEGYRSYASDYGLSLGLLWGADNGGAYSYYVNNESPMDLSDPVKDGDVIHAFIYSDAAGWSDTYCWFDKTEVTAEAGEEVTLTLSSMGYDAAWNVVVAPLSGAVLTVNGVPSDAVSGEDGSVSFTAPEAGEYILSAVCEGMVLCAPACKLIVK